MTFPPLFCLADLTLNFKIVVIKNIKSVKNKKKS